MAYSLTSERPGLAAATFNPIRAFTRWITDARARHAQRVALSNLLELDASLLYDLGIDRGDVLDALRAPHRPAGERLAARRAQAARNWRSRP